MGFSRFKPSPAIERTLDGVVFASKREMHRYSQLKLLERAGIIECLTCQPSFAVEIDGIPFCTYTADFGYFDVQGNKVVVEDVKSSGTAKDAAYRLRKKAAELFYSMQVVEVFA